MAKNVKLSVTVDVNGRPLIEQTSRMAKEASKNLKGMGDAARGARSSLASLRDISMVATGLSTAFQSITAECKVLTDAYQLQLESETKLETVMRQRMNASAQDIQAMKDLASAQQQIGIIGDEVTLMGMQQLATFINQRQSLEALTPAMLNLLAQQKGFNATANDSVAIANLFGKAMQGNASALTRVGITMSEAQKEALKNGNEMERASLLAQIITENVGNMNEQLAQTDAGKAKQVANAFGDWQEQIGALIMPFQTLITQIGSIGTAANTFILLGSGVGTAVKALWAFISAQKMGAVTTAATNIGVKALNATFRACGVATRVGELGVRGLAIAVRSLMVAGGVTALIWAFNEACERLGLFSTAAADATNDLTREMSPLEQGLQQAKQSGEQWLVTAESQRAKLKQLMDAHADTSAMVKELNAQYGAIFGQCATAAQWYDTLTQKSRAYADQLIKEAEAKAIAADLAEKKIRFRQISRDLEEGIISGKYLAAAPIPTSGYNNQQALNYNLKNAAWTSAGAPYRNDVKLTIEGGIKKQAKDALWKEIRQETAELRNVLDSGNAAAAKVGARTVSTGGGGGRSYTSRARGGGGRASVATTEPAKVDFEQWEFVPEDQMLQGELDKALEQIQLADLMRKNFDSVMSDKIGRIKEALGKTQNTEQKKELQSLLTKAEEEQAAGVEPWEEAYLKALDDYDALRQSIEPRIQQLQDFRAQLALPMSGPLPMDGFEAWLDFLDNLVDRADIGEIPTRDFDEWLAYLNDLAAKVDGDTLKKINKAISDVTMAKERMIRESTAAPEVDRLAPTMSQLDNAIQFYTEQQQFADAEQILKLQMTIGMLTKKRNTIAFVTEFPDVQQELVRLRNLTGKELKVELNAIGFDEIESRIKHLQDILSEAGGLLPEWMADGISEMISEYKDLQQQVGKTNGETGNTTSGISNAASAIDGLAQSISRTSEENKNLAASMTIVSAAASIAQLIAGFVAKLNAPGSTVGIWDYIAAAATGTATIIGCITSLKGVGAFAEGGVVSGPTLALVGEYAGATNNPEVIAPLSKLQSMIQTEQGASGGKVEFEIKERKLRGVLRKGAKYNSRR